MRKYTILETFVGAGGAHLGFKNKGFISKYVNDIENTTLKTLLLNNPEIQETAFIDNRDIIDINGNDILEKTGLKQGEADVFFSGIVCKGFSLAGQRSPNDERNYFYRKQLEIIDVVRPKLSVIENVPGIINAKVLSCSTPKALVNQIGEIWKELEKYNGVKAELRKKNQITVEIMNIGKAIHERRRKILEELESKNYLISVIDDIKETYEKIGYKMYIEKLNASWYGSYTSRERVIIVGVKNDINIEFKYPEKTHNVPRTVNEALAQINYFIEDTDNIPMKHTPKTIERFKYIPEGKNVVDVMDLIPNNLKISSYYSRGSTMRLDGNRPSPTLVPGHSNFPVHPREHRSITVREAATISGFPIDYKFIGSHTKRCEHVGNAVPVHLSEALAESCIELLSSYYKSLIQ